MGVGNTEAQRHRGTEKRGEGGRGRRGRGSNGFWPCRVVELERENDRGDQENVERVGDLTV